MVGSNAVDCRTQAGNTTILIIKLGHIVSDTMKNVHRTLKALSQNKEESALAEHAVSFHGSSSPGLTTPNDGLPSRATQNCAVPHRVPRQVPQVEALN